MNVDLSISVRNVSKIFSNGTVAIRNVSFDIFNGEFVVFGGANGSGKSVLMSLISSLDVPTKGEIETASKVGIVFQNADTQILGETVIEDVMFAPLNSGLNKKEAHNIALSAITKCGLLEKIETSARLLSGGEKRRLAVAGILAMNCNTIIFDEPFANLDLFGVQQVTSILRELKADGKTVIVLTHEIEKCLALADRFIVLYNGEICFDGKPQDGLRSDLEKWGIRNPLVKYNDENDLIW